MDNNDAVKDKIIIDQVTVEVRPWARLGSMGHSTIAEIDVTVEVRGKKWTVRNACNVNDLESRLEYYVGRAVAEIKHALLSAVVDA